MAVLLYHLKAGDSLGSASVSCVPRLVDGTPYRIVFPLFLEVSKARVDKARSLV